MDNGTKARNELLRDWLNSHHAVCNWQKRIPYVGLVESWTANGRVFIVQRYSNDQGWEVYIPAHDGNRSLDTLRQASFYILGEKQPA